MNSTLRRRLGYLGPFAAAAILSFALAPLPDDTTAWVQWALAWALALAVAAIVLATPWRTISPWWALIPVLMYLASVGLLREAGGGNSSGVGPMVLLPMIWLALHGTPRVLIAALVAVPWIYWAPIIITGADERYPVSGWRIGAMVAVLAGLMGIAIQRLHGRERDLAQRLQRLAYADQLTGLPNRRAWDAALETELAHAARRGEPFCVAIIDLDHFKALNDQAGHAAGDRLLRQLAADWSDALRAGDTVARIGGDEFGVLLPDADADAATAVLQRMRERTAHAWSYGLEQWQPPESAAQLTRRADAALYQAKHDRDDVPSAAAHA